MEDAREAAGRRRLRGRVEEEADDARVERRAVSDLDREEERGLALVDAFELVDVAAGIDILLAGAVLSARGA